MLLVKTYLAPSKIHGYGLFAAEHIKEGTKIWEFIPGFDRKIKKSQIDSLPAVAQEYILNYTYLNKHTGEYVLSADNDRFSNHSRDANTKNIKIEEGDLISFASRDIQIDEEITTNYYELEDGSFEYC